MRVILRLARGLRVSPRALRSRRVALCAAALCGAARGALDAPAPPASHPYAPPPPYYAEAQPAYAQNLWEIPPPPDARVALRPFRLATKQSVAFVYGLMAWRATSLAERAAAFGTPGAPLAKPLFAMNAAGCLIAARGAQKRKVALKAMLGVDVALEGLAAIVSLANALFPGAGGPSPDAHGLNALCAFWMGLICYTCSRSKWIASLPVGRKTAANPGLNPYGGPAPYGAPPPPPVQQPPAPPR